MTPFYVDSEGKRHIVADMPYRYLVNARRKLEKTPIIGGDATAAERMREFGARDELVAAMRAEEARRNVSYAASIGPNTPIAEMQKAMTDMAHSRQMAGEWTAERQGVFDAIQAEMERRGL